jgi:ABC-type phosphate/phosphonate transport system substrate-binding protein
MIACARMYAIGDAATAAWRTLLEWVVARAAVDCEVIDYPAPQPLADLWVRSDLGCAFMCGYPFSTTMPRPALLAAPVPSPPSHGGRPVYWSDIVVAADSGRQRLEDTFGGRFAWTGHDSYSGWHAPRLMLAPHAQRRGGALFAATVGPLVTPRAVAVAVAEGRADAGPLDCYAHALLQAHEPALSARLKVIAQTPAAPIPPLVGASQMSPADTSRLRAALADAGREPRLASARKTLALDRFAAITPEAYDRLAADARRADAMGYPRIA